MKNKLKNFGNQVPTNDFFRFFKIIFDLKPLLPNKPKLSFSLNFDIFYLGNPKLTIITKKRMSGKYYAVAHGREAGIFRSWSETEKQVKGFPKAKYKSFKTLAEAEAYLGQTTSDELKPPSFFAIPLEPNYPNLTVYTDGSCVDKVGGYGNVIIHQNDVIPIKGKVPFYPTTNQVSELYAIYAAIYYVTQVYPNEKKITIYTDSKYSIGCLTEWWYNWVKNGWINSKGEPVSNKELIQSILTISKNLNINYIHVKAHNGDKYNEMADRLANEGRLIK